MAKLVRAWEAAQSRRTGANGCHIMLLFIVTLLIAVVLAGLIRGRVPRAKKDTALGVMSEQWLAEYRAMHSS